VKYTVTWLPSAQDELTEIWLRAENRGVVADAANEIDQQLKVDPDRRGVAFAHGRILYVAPLAVSFYVRADDRIAEIVQVRYIPLR
jgi:plasmid stabilization system protein ParE